MHHSLKSSDPVPTGSSESARPGGAQMAMIDTSGLFIDMMFVACSLAGLVMVVGGICLIAKEKIYIDRETQRPIEVELPGGVRFKANIPALALFLIGFVPLLYPVYKLNPPQYRQVKHAKITGKFDPRIDAVVVYASIAQDPSGRGEFHIPAAPFVLDDNTDYKVLLISNDFVLDQKHVSLENIKNGEITVQFDSPPPEQHYARSSVEPVPAEFQPGR